MAKKPDIISPTWFEKFLDFSKSLEWLKTEYNQTTMVGETLGFYVSRMAKNSKPVVFFDVEKVSTF